MGSSYASLHVMPATSDSGISKIGMWIQSKPLVIPDFAQIHRNLHGKELTSEELQHWIDGWKLLQQVGVVPAVVQKKDVVSVYDEDADFGSIEKDAISLSENLPVPVFYVSNFDDDVLIFGLASQGKIVAVKKVVLPVSEAEIKEAYDNLKAMNITDENCADSRIDTETSYGVTPEERSTQLIWDHLRTVSPGERTSQDIKALERYVKKALGVPLSLKSRDFSKHSDRYELIEKTAHYKIYRSH